jgi:hypothetical protein
MYSDLWLERYVYRDRSLRDRPRFLPRVLTPLPIIPHFGYRVSFPRKEGGMLADLVSSVLGYLSLLKEGGMLADLESTPVLTGATFMYRLSRVLAGPRSVCNNCSVYQRRVEAEDLRGAFPPFARMVFRGVRNIVISELARSFLFEVGSRRGTHRAANNQDSFGRTSPTGQSSPPLCPFVLCDALRPLSVHCHVLSV